MKLTRTTLALTTLTLGTAAQATQAAMPMLYEEAFAQREEKQIFTAPIADTKNSLWSDYLIDVTEAQKELSSDLRRADDIKDMSKRGYRMGEVTVLPAE